MRATLWSKLLGVLIGVLIGASVAYAASTVYNYSVNVTTGISVKVSTSTLPGSPEQGLTSDTTTLAFGEVQPGTYSEEKPVKITNSGLDVILLKIGAEDLPTNSLRLWVRADGWEEVLPGVPVTYSSEVQPGGIVDFYFKVYVQSTASEGSQQSFNVSIYN